MEFFFRPQHGRPNKPLLPAVLPAVYLVPDDWDDYTYKTTFEVIYFDAKGNVRTIGNTKILKRNEHVTRPPDRFQVLSQEYCSLGQSLEFYQTLLALGTGTAREILRALRDVVLEPSFEGGLRDSEGFNKSLLRFSEAEKAYKEGGALFGRQTHLREGFDFTFTCLLKGFSRAHKVQCDFMPLSGLPHRILTFVGKNGTGKSGVLASLATTLSGWDETPLDSFEPERPRFSRVISLSYSIFQPFAVPSVNTTSYRYCGLRDNEGQVNVEAFHARTLSSIQEIRNRGRSRNWRDLMKLEDIFGSQVPEIDTDEGVRNLSGLLETLSSGQRIVVSIFSDLLQHIDTQSLILFDEPEVYLHPTLLSTLMRMLHKLLEDHDAYAIVATHSPIVVQEIPARSVRVFERQGSVPSQSRLPIESFGENLTEIVNHVFHMNEGDKNYKTLLQKLAQQHSFEQVMSLFEEQLSMNARMYLLSLTRRG